MFPAAPEPERGESGSSAVAAGLGGGLAVVIVTAAVIVVALVVVIVILLRKLGRAEELLGEPPKTTKRYSVLKTHSACLSSRMCVECAKYYLSDDFGYYILLTQECWVVQDYWQ